MKKQILAVVAIAVALLMQSCTKVNGDGPVVTEERQVSPFTGIELDLNADVYYTQDAVQKVEIRAQQNIINRLNVYVSGGKLMLKKDPATVFYSFERIKIYVSAPDAHDLRVNGSGTIQLLQPVQFTDSRLDVSGSGDIVLNQITGNSLSARISGSGTIKVNTGVLQNEEFNISGSGDINVVGVVANKATTRTSGSGNIRLQATQSIDAYISGSGDVYYLGSPSINTHISGSGRVQKL
ncbi:MAG: head GIN domain-containing protein [Chitinophagaceae bacterium]